MTYSQARIREGERIGEKKGEKKGEIKSKQETLIRQIDRKYGIADEERDKILSIQDPDILDDALDEFAVSEEKTSVLAALQKES